MRTCRIFPGFLALTILAIGARAVAQDKKPVAEKHDAAALAEALRDVINTGAELFNSNGDYAGCYRVYQGALLSIKPFLTPALQEKIDRSIAKAEGMRRYSDRAFELRATIDEIRAHSKGAGGETAPTPKKEIIKIEPIKEPKKVETKQVEPKKVEAKKGDMKSGVVDPNAGQLSGKVTYRGQPAPPGFITLVGASQRFSASITADGSYQFKTPIPPGEYRIAIERVPGAQIPAKLDIPERYRSEKTSGLLYQVKGGKQNLDIELTK